MSEACRWSDKLLRHESSECDTDSPDLPGVARDGYRVGKPQNMLLMNTTCDIRITKITVCMLISFNTNI